MKRGLRIALTLVLPALLMVGAVLVLWLAEPLLAWRGWSELRIVIAVRAVAAAAVVVAVIQLLYVGIASKRSDQLAAMGEELEADRRRLQFLEQRYPTLRADVENLSAMREISRAVSVWVELEHILEEVLRIVASLTEAMDVSIFLQEESGTRMALRAYYRQGGHERPGYMYAYFTPGLTATGDRGFTLDETEVRRTSIASRIAGELLRRGQPVGRGHLVIEGFNGSDDEAKAEFAGVCRSMRLSDENILDVIKSRQVLEVDEEDCIDISGPLIAEHESVGAVKIRVSPGMPEDALAGLRAQLKEAGNHVGLAIKKADLYDKAVRDGMTGLYSKRHFVHQLDTLVGIAQRHEHPLAFVILDIDHFKNVNDTWGHLTGDKILIGVSKIIHDQVRASDAAFRYGGEELAVLMPETSVADAKIFAERLRAAVEDAEFIGAKKEKIKITISIGVAAWTGRMKKPQDLVGAADKALYEAKDGGRNQVRTYGTARTKTGDSKSGKSAQSRATGSK